jgi:hypothetical protein
MATGNMKVSVYSDSPNVKVHAYYEGDGALEIARSFSLEMSKFAEITLKTDKFKEIYAKGKLKSSSFTTTILAAESRPQRES